jgi:hypothetical protein
MKAQRQNSFGKSQVFRSKVIILLIIQSCLLLLTGCWYTAISRYFDDGSDLGKMYEWQFSVTVSAFFRADKKTFVKDYGRPPEAKYDYGLGLTFWTITEIDTTLSEKDRRDVRVDSVKIVFENFTKAFLVQNTFEDNKRTNKFGYVTLKYLKAYTKTGIDSIYIPPGIQYVDITVYGTFRSLKDGLEPFKLSTRLHYRETSERISKYD